MSTEMAGLTSFDLDEVRRSRPGVKHALTAFSAATLTAGTASLATTTRDFMWFGGTTAGVSPAQPSELVVSLPVAKVPAIASPAERVTALKADTDLTWDQVARLFGVSRRAVHQWAVGGRMNSHNTELLAQLERMLVVEVPARDASARRAALFMPDATGVTPFERALALRAEPDANVSGTALTALEQVSSAR